MNSRLKDIPDNAIREEYRLRFQKKQGERLQSSASSARHLRAFLDQLPNDQEHFVVVFLNSQLRIITTELISSGSLATAAVFPREIIKRVLALECGSLICGHNHPSGETHPSSSDRALTSKLKRAVESVDCTLWDHLVLGDSENFYSFSDQGLL
jgi:DNA repair protein RadC